MTRLLLLLALLLAAPVHAQIGDTTDRLEDPALEARARAVGRELRCLVCQNQSIEDSDASLARDLRVLVREQIAAGRTEEETLRFVHERYGDFVLLRPPVGVHTILLWAAPFLFLGGGLVAIALTRSRRAAAGIGDTELSPEEKARLARLEGPPPP